MDLIKRHQSEITSETSSEDRYALLCSLMMYVEEEMDQEANYDGDTVTEMVKLLLRVSLDSVHTTSELRDWLVSQMVTKIITRLNTGPDIAYAILRGMSEAVRTVGVGFDNLITWCSELLHAWFVKKDNTIFPTSPGFVFEIFTLHEKCADRQVEVCGIRTAATIMDRRLLPLVSGALPTETDESINQRDKDGHTALHYSADIMRLPQVTKSLLTHPDINVNAIDFTGFTPLSRTVPELVKGDEEAAATIEAMMADPRLDLSVRDYLNNTAVDICFKLFENNNTNARYVLKFIQMSLKHTSVTQGLIHTIITNLMKLALFSAAQALHEQVIVDAASNQWFDINKELNDEGQTLGHVAALYGKGNLLLKVMDIKKINPVLQDDNGNTILHYVCANVPPGLTRKVIDHPSVAWDFTLMNNEFQTVLDYYERLPKEKRNHILLGILEERVGRVSSLEDDVQQGDPEMRISYPAPVPEEPPGGPEPRIERAQSVFLRSQGDPEMRISYPAPVPEEPPAFPEPGQTLESVVRELQWNSPISRTAVGVQVQPTTQCFVNTKLEGISNNTVFRMTSAKKGKACIICISEFRVQKLRSLNPGYTNDRKRLVELWSQMGYDVLVPSCVGGGQLTAEEIRHALREFSQMLTEEDQSAVVCLLSHGRQGHIYGNDGKLVSLIDLLNNLDNDKCPQMKKKPKVSIVQACAGCTADYGVAASLSSGISLAYAAANEPPLPTMSDLVICSPSQQGYESYVRDEGSVFITRLAAIFARYAKKEDILKLMTRVNQAISEEDILVENRRDGCKQISRVESCLTKLLYFLPCPNGKKGDDWLLLSNM